MNLFRFNAPRPPQDWINSYCGPASFADWTDAEIMEMSRIIRIHGQPDSEGWRRQARMCLNAIRGGASVEMVARVINGTLNGEETNDRPVRGSHYMHGMPMWCVWLENARPAVADVVARWRAGAADGQTER